MKKLLFSYGLYLCIAVGLSAQPATSPALLIKAGHLVDPVQGRVLDNQQLLVKDGKVVHVGANLQAPTGATVLDLSNAWVLPGLIDCHTHITHEGGNFNNFIRRNSLDWAVLSPGYALKTLQAGFTTVRDLGAGNFLDVALKKAIDGGQVLGPRIVPAGLGIGATGGHADEVGYPITLHFEGESGVADGVDEIRKKVRHNVKYGADVIKFMATAGVLSEEESVGAPQYSLEEMRALIEEASMWGRRTAAHAHGTEGIKRAVQAGVTSIEHGSLLDDEAVRMMKEKGTYLVPTEFVLDYILQNFEQGGYPDRIMNKARSLQGKMKQSYQLAVKGGVKIAFGTDAGVFPHGLNGKQFTYMVGYGLSPMQAIQSATTAAADLLGRSAEVGSLQPGRWADLIALPSDPTQDIKALEQVPLVIKGGVVVKNELTK